MYLLIAKKEAGAHYHCGDCIHSWHAKFDYFNNLSKDILLNKLSKYIFKNIRHPDESPYQFLIFINGVLIYDTIDNCGPTWDSIEEEPQGIAEFLEVLFKDARCLADIELSNERIKEDEKKIRQAKAREEKDKEARRQQFEKLSVEFLENRLDFSK